MDFVFTFEDSQICARLPFYSKFACSIPKHSHSINSYEIHYIPSGKGIVRIFETDYPLSSGTLYITGPNIEHEQIPDSEEPMSEYCLYFQIIKPKKSVIDNRPLLNIIENTPFWIGRDRFNIESTLQLLISEMNEKNIGYDKQAVLLFQQLIIILTRNYSHSNHVTKKKEEKFLYDPYLYIEQSFLYNYSDLTLEKLASDIGLSCRQTERILKNNYNMTFRQKKHKAKMSAAKIMLSDKNLSVRTISERLNYSSADHFSASFKKYYGVSPRQFRKNQ